MSFWLPVAILLALTAGYIVWPLLRPPARQPDSADYDLEVYKDQLDELARAESQGLVSAEEARSARAEIERRVLATDRRRAERPAGRTGQRIVLPILLAGAVAAGGLTLYLRLGDPDYPDRPLAARDQERALALRERRQPPPGQDPALAEQTPAERQAMIEGMVEGLAARLREQPDDLEGWLRLARSYRVLERPEKELEALAEAARLAPRDPRVLLLYARGLRGGAGNRSTPETLALMRRVVEIDPDNPEALWFLAVAAAASGAREEARNLFDRALAALPPGAPGRTDLRARADEILRDAPGGAGDGGERGG